MMLATPQTTAEKMSSGNVTFPTFFQNDKLFDAEPDDDWFEYCTSAAQAGMSLGLSMVIHARTLVKLTNAFLPVLSGNAFDTEAASYPEMAMGVSLGVNTVQAFWGRSKNTGKSEADKVLIERFRNVFEETQALHAVEVKTLHSQLERSKEDVQRAETAQRGIALQAAAEVGAARTELHKATSAAEKVAGNLEEANNLLDTCRESTNKLKEKLGSCPEQLKQLNWAKFLAQLFSSAFGLVGWMLMFAMNIVGFVFSFPKLITFVVYLLFCFFLPAWGAGVTLCALCAMVFCAATTPTPAPANDLTKEIEELTKINAELAEKHNQLQDQLTATKTLYKQKKVELAAKKKA